MNRLPILLALAGVVSGFCRAQQNFTLYNMPVIPQSSYTNPAFIPDKKINIGLPVISSFYLGLSNSSFKFSDLVKKSPDDSVYLDVDNMVSNLSKKNYLSVALQPDLFSFGIVVKKNYFNFNITEKAGINFRYPKDFMEFVSKGNGAFLGEEKKFDFGLNLMHYREYGISMAHEINEKLTVGGKLKYLYGMENVRTAVSDISLTTDGTNSPSFFDITAKANIEINTSGVDSASSKNRDAASYLFKKKNKGLGIDLGGTYKYSEKISLSASLLDLGFIRWKSNVTNIVSKNPDARFTFKGIDISAFLDSSGTNMDSAFAQVGDSLENIFGLERTHDSYKTALASQFYIGANYLVHKKISIGGLLYGQFFDGSLRPAVSASGNFKLTKWFSASVSYSVFNRNFANLGMGMAITFPVQFYIVMDNILPFMNMARYPGPYKEDGNGNQTRERRFSFVAPQGALSFNLRFGINITFGRKNKGEDDSLVVPSSMY